MFLGIFNVFDTKPCEPTDSGKERFNQGLARLVLPFTHATAGAGCSGRMHGQDVRVDVAGLDYFGAPRG